MVLNIYKSPLSRDYLSRIISLDDMNIDQKFTIIKAYLNGLQDAGAEFEAIYDGTYVTSDVLEISLTICDHIMLSRPIKILNGGHES